MPKNTGLGKGLDALFANKPIIEEEKIQYWEKIQKIKKHY